MKKTIIYTLMIAAMFLVGLSSLSAQATYVSNDQAIVLLEVEAASLYDGYTTTSDKDVLMYVTNRVLERLVGNLPIMLALSQSEQLADIAYPQDKILIDDIIAKMDTAFIQN